MSFKLKSCETGIFLENKFNLFAGIKVRMDKLGVFLRLPKINLAPLTINSPTPSPTLVKIDITASFPPINSSLNTHTLEVKNDNSLANLGHELAFKHHQNLSKRLRNNGKENSLTPDDILMNNSHRDEEIKEDESQDHTKDLKSAVMQNPKKFLKKGGGNSHIKKSNSLPKIIHHAYIDFKDPIQTNQNSQTKYFNRKYSKSSLIMIFNQKHEKRASLNLDRSINTLLTFSHDPQKNISILHNETDSLSTTQDIQGINKLITDDKSDTQKNDVIFNPSSSKKVNLNIGFDSLAHLAGTTKTIHISKLQGLNSHSLKLPTIVSIPKPTPPKVYLPALNSKFPQYSSKPNPLLDSMTESIPNSHKNTQSIQSQTESALVEKSYITQDLGNGFESIQKMLKMCNIRELEKDFNPKNKKNNFLKQIGGQDPNFNNLLIHSYLHTNHPMTHNIDKLDIEKIKVGPRQKFNLKELNHDLTLLNNSNTISDKIKMNKGFKENKDTTLIPIKIVDNMKLQIPIDLGKIMDTKFKFVKPITGERLKSITSGRKATSVDQTNNYTKRSTRPSVHMPNEMKKNNNKIINESINHKNILPDFLKETDKADILKNMAKFIGEEVNIQDEKLDHLINKYDTEFSLYEKS